MKGIVFTEFLEMVERQHGIDMVDRLIDHELESGGAYTAVGVYDHVELLILVNRLHTHTQTLEKTIFIEFGRYLMQQFALQDHASFARFSSGFEFVEQLETFFERSFHPLHPELEVPHFRTRRLGHNSMEVHYTSFRKLGDFAQGIILGVFDHYREKASIKGALLSPQGDEVKFTIRRTA